MTVLLRYAVMNDRSHAETIALKRYEILQLWFVDETRIQVTNDALNKIKREEKERKLVSNWKNKSRSREKN